MRLIPLAAAVAALLVPAAPAFAGDPTMPLWQVHPGMRCTGYSVIQGTAISSFDVDVLEVAGGEATGGSAERMRVPSPAAMITTVGADAGRIVVSALGRAVAPPIYWGVV